ncbi:MAG TPA: LytTR family transcriptional regulator DNA-binding domain-containing protein, partial [bacterium]
REGARIMLIGAAVLSAAVIHDVLRDAELLHGRYLASIGFLAFTFAQAVVLSRRFVRATVTAETLSTSLEHKVEERTQELAAKNQQLEATIEDLRTTRNQLQQFGLSVRVGNDYVVFPYHDIHYLSAREGKTVVHTAQRQHEVARPLKEIEALLTDQRFQRIHRQCIVNVTYVANMAHIGSGGYIAVLRGRNEEPLPVSRIHAPFLKQRLGITE